MGRVVFLFLLLMYPLFGIGADISARQYIRTAERLHLADSDVWKGLIHATKNGKSAIYDPSFLLSYPHFSLHNELVATLEAMLYKNRHQRQQVICKFPARILWLKEKLHITDLNLIFEKCDAFQKYLTKTANDHISLVFASENVSNPSSMMGHTFFKISGKDKQGRDRAHAVSFYTVIDTLNIPWLIVKSTVIGMQGFFSLTPYEEQRFRNNVLENRNIWEYSLRLSENARKLLYYHFWELKDVKLTYLFTGYNCATIMYDMLYIIGVKPKKRGFFWLTPKMLVKEVNRLGIVEKSRLIPSDVWYLKMLEDILTPDSRKHILELYHSGNYQAMATYPFSNKPLQRFAEKALMREYGEYLYFHSHIRRNRYMQIQKYTQSFRVHTKLPELDLSHYKNPLKSPGERQIQLGYDTYDKWMLTFLPAANTLSSDNRQYFSERSLKIGEATLSMRHHSVKLKRFDLYNVVSLIPWDPFTKKLSFAFECNYKTHYNTRLEPYQAYNLSFGGGITRKIGEDIYLFSLLNGGIAYGGKRFYGYLAPEAGWIMYEILHMKSVVRYRYIYHQHNSRSGYHHLLWTQSLFLNRNHRIELEWSKRFKTGKSFQHSILRYVYTF